MAKVQLELGGKYSAGEMFQRAQDDLKSFGRTNKDAIQAGTSALKELQKGFGQDLSGAIDTTRSVLQNIASGGLWGAIGAIASATISKVIDWFNEAKEAAIRFGDSCKNYVTKTLKDIDDSFKNVQGDASSAKQEIQDFASIAQGQIVNAANAKLHQLHIETLQKITDNMSETAKKVILADEALEAAKIKEEMATRIAADKIKVQRDKRDEVEAVLDAAIERREAIENEINNLKSLQTGPIRWYNSLLDQQNTAMTLYKAGVMDASKLKEREATIQGQMNTCMEKHKSTIEAYLALQGKLEQAKRDEITAEENYEHEKRVLTTVVQQNKDSLIAANTAVLSATQAKKDAENADKKYAQQQSEAADKEKIRQNEKQAAHDEKMRKEAEQIAAKRLETDLLKEDLWISRQLHQNKQEEAYWIGVYNNFRRNGMSVEEAKINVNQEYLNAKRLESNISKLCTKYKAEEKDYISRFNELLYKGIDANDAYVEVQKELNDSLKQRNSAEKKATDELNKQNENDKNGKGNGNGGNDKNKNAVNVSFTADVMGDLAEQMERKFGFGNWMKENRKEARKIRDQKNQIKIDQPLMVKYLKRDMPKEQADKFTQYLKSKYTPDMVKELGNEAIKHQLLTKAQAQQQKRAVENIASTIKTALAIK